MEESHHSYNDSKMYKNRKYGAVGSATGAGSSREHKVALTGLLREHTTEMESRELLKTAKGLNAGTSGRPMTDRTWTWWTHSLMRLTANLPLWPPIHANTHAHHGEGQRPLPAWFSSTYKHTRVRGRNQGPLNFIHAGLVSAITLL